MDPSRPLDALNNNRDKQVVVELKNGRRFRGILKSFDIHINTVLFSAQELGVEKQELGMVFIRGDTIQVLYPEAKQ
ncbi:MAG: LSM domain-containing protein [Candidatus Woesearchaeota archaeon]